MNYYSKFLKLALFLLIGQVMLGSSILNNHFFTVNKVPNTYNQNFNYNPKFEALKLGKLTGRNQVSNKPLIIEFSYLYSISDSALKGVLYCTPSITRDVIMPSACERIVSYTPPTSNNPIRHMKLITGLPSGSSFPVGVTTVTYQEYDNLTNNPQSAICTFSVTVKEYIPPTISCIADQTKSSDADFCFYTVIGTEFDPVANDDCGIASLTNSLNGGSTLAGEQIPKGLETITWTVTDKSGNSTTCTFTVTVTDDESPTVTAASDIEEGMDAGVCTASIAIPDATFNDNCSSTLSWAMIGATVASGTGQVGTQTFSSGITTITYTNTDGITTAATDSMTVTVTDDEEPALTPAANQYINLDVGCQITIPDVMGSATDNCTVTITQSPAVGSKVSLVHDGTTTVTVTATDAAGNTDVKNVVLTAKDVTAPVLTADSNQAVNLDADCEITVPDVMGSATDNCTVTITQSPAVGSKVSLVHDGTTTVTVTATDAAGNTDVKNVVLTAKDVTNPVLTVASDDDVNLDADCEITVPDVMGSATDNCTVTITQSPAVGSKVSLVHDGTTTVTVTATDAAGNTDIKNVVLTAKDVTNPVLTVASDDDVNLDADCEITVPDVMGSATDNCTVTITQSPAVGSKVSLVHDGTTTVTVTATDAAGNTDVKNVVLTAKDVTNPVLTVASDDDVNLDAGCEITVPDVMGSATDNCTVTITQSPAVGSKVSLVHDWTTTVTVTATDAAGNTDVKNVVLTAKDVTNPVLTVASDDDVNLDAGCEITVPDVMGSATDNCTVTITQSPAVGSKVSLVHDGTTTVTVTATDAAGNTDVKNVVLTAKDVTAPVLTADSNQAVNLDADCEITVPDVMGSATDNCTVTITQSPAVGSKVSLTHDGTTTVTVTATDAAGNTDVKNVVLTAKDVTNPVLTVASDDDVNLDADCEITVPDVMGSATDNCTVTITQSPAVGSKVSLVHDGTTTVTVTATDAAGNTDIKNVVLT
ncbi:HYR domain-containing protein, partial [Gelidibacter sediminis]